MHVHIKGSLQYMQYSLYQVYPAYITICISVYLLHTDTYVLYIFKESTEFIYTSYANNVHMYTHGIFSVYFILVAFAHIHIYFICVYISRTLCITGEHT